MAAPPEGRPRSPRRPAIPREVARAVLIESGHRCAVCGVPCPLERAHIVPWCTSQAHQQEDLICLCANCHQRADLESWGEKTLQQYKLRPWVMRQNLPGPAAVVTELEITIDLEMADFDDHKEDMLVHALAGLLKISPKSIRVRSKRAGSVKITLEMPEPEARKLAELFKEDPQVLADSMPLFEVLDVRESRASGLMHREAAGTGATAMVVGGGVVITSSESRVFTVDARKVRQILTRYCIPATDANDLVEETLLTAIYKWEAIQNHAAWFLQTLRNRCVLYWRRRGAKVNEALDTAILDLLSDARGEDRDELLHDLSTIIEKTPPRCRRFLRLRYGLEEGTGLAGKEELHPREESRFARRCITALADRFLESGTPEDEASAE